MRLNLLVNIPVASGVYQEKVTLYVLMQLVFFCSSHRLSIWGENEEEEKLENLEEALESFCDVSMRALQEQY